MLAIVNCVLKWFGLVAVHIDEYNGVLRCLNEYDNMGPEDLRRLADDLESDME